MRNYKNYLVWQMSHQLTLKIYRITKDFPKAEQFGIVSQIQRAAVSVPTNIAEGAGRDSDIDFRRFLSISAGSICEVGYLLLLSKELGYIDESLFDQTILDVESIQKALNSLISKIKKEL